MDNQEQYDIAQQLMNLYCFYRSKWVMQKPAANNACLMITQQTKFRVHQVIQHMLGFYSMCVFAGTKATGFISIDVDVGGADAVRKVIDTMVDIGIPKDRIYVSFSGRKGYHVDIFFHKYIWNDKARIFYEELIYRSGLDRRKIEFRPTSGQAIKLPLGVHQATGNRCWFLDPETMEPIEDMGYVHKIQKLDADWFHELVNGIMKSHYNDIYTEKKEIMSARPAPEDKKRDEPPKPKAKFHGMSLMLTAPGTRHNVQTKVAARARMDGHDYDEIVDIQMDWYSKQNQAYINSSEDEVRLDAEQIAAWAMRVVQVNEKNKEKPKPEETVKTVGIVVTKDMIPYVLNAPTKSVRLIMFFLMLFSIKYGEIMVSYDKIGYYTGMSVPTIAKAIKWLSENKFIGKKNTIAKQSKFFVLKGCNAYSFPGEKKFRAPYNKYLQRDSVAIKAFVTKDNLEDVYYQTLASMVKPEYLAKYLSKPELKECEVRLAHGVSDTIECDPRPDGDVAAVCGSEGDSAGLADTDAEGVEPDRVPEPDM